MPAPRPTVAILGTQTHPHAPHSPHSPPTPSLPLSTSATSPVQIYPRKPQRGGRPASPRCPLRNHERVWFRLEQGSHLFWAHLCWLTHVLTGKLAACSMGRGSTSPVGYQFLTCSPPPPPSGPPAPQPTTSSNAPIATHSHPPTHSNQPSSPLYFCLCFNPATYHPAFSLKLKNRHCFTVTFSWCFVRADHLGLFYDKCVSHVLFRDLLSWEYTKRREDNKEKDKEAERDRADSVQTLSQTYSICCIYICTCTYKIKKKFEATCLCIGNRDYLIWLEHQLQTRHYPSSYFHYNTGKG